MVELALLAPTSHIFCSTISTKESKTPINLRDFTLENLGLLRNQAYSSYCVQTSDLNAGMNLDLCDCQLQFFHFINEKPETRVRLVQDQST